MALDYETMPDEDLVKRIRQRGAVDERPMTVLFQRHSALVWNVCRRFMPTDADAEDLLQDVFLRVYQGLPSFQGQARFSTWLYRIAVNTCLNEIRRRRRRVEVHEIPIDELSMHSDQHHQREQHQREVIREQLSSALATLTEEARVAIRLRELEGRSYAEMAHVLGIKTSAAKMRVQRARLVLLASLIEEQEPR